MEATPRSTPTASAPPTRMTQAREAVKRCDEHLVAAGKLAIQSGQYREGTQELLVAVRELAAGVSVYRAGAVATPRPSGAPPSPPAYDVAREAAFIELAADERRRGEAARREFALDPVRWGKAHGRYARTLALTLPNLEHDPSIARSSARATPAPRDPRTDEATFSEMWTAVDALSRQFKEAVLERKKGTPSPAQARVSVDWLSRPPE